MCPSQRARRPTGRALSPERRDGSRRDRFLAGVVELLVDPFLAAERAAEIGEKGGLDRRYGEPPAVARRVHVVARVAPRQDIAAGARLLASGEIAIDVQRHELQRAVCDRNVEVFTDPGRLAAVQRHENRDDGVHAAGCAVCDRSTRQ